MFLFSSKLAPALDSVFKILKTSVVGMKAQQTAAIGAAAGTEVLGTAAQGAATKVAILQKTLGWLSLAFTVISVGVGLWSDYKKAQEEVRIESIEAGNAVADEASSMDELYSSIEKLSNIQDRTEEQESNLLQLNSDIIEKLGDRKIALENLTVGSKEYTEALKNQIIEEAKANEASLRKSKTDAEQALKSDIPSRGFLAAPLKISNEDLGKDLRNQLAEIFNESSKASAGKYFDFYVERIDSSTVATLQFYDDLLKAKKAIDDESNALNDAGKNTEASNLLQTESYSELNKEIARYSEYIDDYLKSSLNVEINNRRINGTLPTTVEEFEAFRAEMLKGYGVVGEYSDEFGNLIDSVFSALSGKVGDATWKLEESNKVVEDATTKTKLLSDQIDTLQSAYKTLESVIDEYNKTGNLSLDSVQSILSLGDEYLQYLTNENGQLMLNEEGLQNLAIARLNELKASAMQETASKLQYLIDEKELTDDTTESVQALTEADIEALVVQAGSSEEAEALVEAMRLRISLIDELIDDTGILNTVTGESAETTKSVAEIYEDQSSALDTAQSSYETLTSAIDEYNKTGVLSIDTLQEVLDLSPEYLQMFFDQANALGDANAATMDKVEALKLAKIQELQAAAAQDIYNLSIGNVDGLSDIAKSAIAGFGTSAANSGTKALTAAAQVDVLADSLRDAIAASKGDYAGTSDFKAKAAAIVNAYKGIAGEVSKIGVGISLGGSSGGGGGGGTSKAQQQAEDIKTAYESLLGSTMSMLKQKTNDRIDQLEDELDIEEELYKAEKQRIEDAIDGYKEIIDAKKKSLQLDKDEKDYQDEISEKNKEISDIQNRLLELSFDNSESAKTERLKLEEDLVAKQKDLSDTQYDRETELSEAALDNDFDRYEASQDAQIKTLDEAFEATKVDYEDRIELLKTYLEQENIIRTEAINLIAGKTATFYNELFSWNQKYGETSNAILQSVIDKAQETVSAVSSSSGSSKKTKTPTKLTTITPKGTFNAIDWKSLKAHHDGLDSGFVGGVKGNETLIKALDGEFLMTKGQQDNFMNKVLPNMLNNASSGNNIKCDNLLSINVSGNLDSKSEANVIAAVNSQFKELNKVLAGNGLVRKANGFA